MKSSKPDDLSYQCLTTVLDSLDALVYVADMDTYELIYTNNYGRDIWGDIQGKTCWKVLQENQDGPCAFCTNHRLLDEQGKPAGVYVWELQNTVNKKWYQCRDQAITWLDGRIVRMEIATDISDLKTTQASLLAAKQQAEQRANVDELTGLNNRRAFFDLGNRVFSQARRFKHDVSVIMMDIDHFKNINDNYGHSTGDEVLRIVADKMKANIREVDILARIGGEEFALILPETAAEQAHNLAERIRLQLSDESIRHENQTLNVTASFGISSGRIADETLETMLTEADDALYIAKKKGRNQVKLCP